MSSKPTKAILSVCWDRSRYYFIVAKTKKNSTTIVTAKSASWDAQFNAQEAAERIAEELVRQKIRKPALVIGVARAQVDTCTAELPPATADEVSQMVRNEVGRQFGELPDAAVIDFDLDQNGDQSVAHAFVLRSESAQNIQAFSNAIGLEVHAILLRHYSVASRFGRVCDQPEASGLLLNLLDESADLLVVKDRQVAAARTIHYGKGPGSIQMDRLSSEVLRTIAANPSIGTVERVFVFGRDVAANHFVAAIKEALPYEVELLDPLKETEHSGIRGDDPSFPMAALVGMVCDVQDGSAMIDFANPKQPPAPPNRWRKAAFYTVAAAAVIAIVTHTLGGDLNELDSSISGLQSKLDHQKQILEKLESRTIIVDAVDRWENAGVNWLDEIRDLTVRFPDQGDAMIDRMSCTEGQVGGTISMGVRVREPSIVTELESALRDSYRQMRSKRISQADQGQPFPCQFETTVVMRRRPKELYLDLLPQLVSRQSEEAPTSSGKTEGETPRVEGTP